MLPRIWLVVCVASLLACPAAADEQPRYNLVRLQSQESEPVSNDTMHVTLIASGERRDAAELASQINADMTWALDLAKRHADVKVSTGNYRTWQVRQDNKMKGWQARQELMLESRDTPALSQLTGLLQEKLQVDSMRFSVSAETRTRVENRLIELALQAFKVRAGIIGSKLQANGYRIVDLDIGTFAQQPPVVYRAQGAVAAMDSRMPVATEGGESDIRVTVSGTIELTMP
ncbi:MAG: SIMPL domain-containing protein [Gammaproteobacteria bacterium]